MRQEVHDALKDSGLPEARRRVIREQFNVGARPLRDDEVAALTAAVEQAQQAEATTAADPVHQLRQRLDACFFGTPVPRAPEEGVRRPRHEHDGWRDGHSHPFQATLAPSLFDNKGPQKMLLRVAGVTAPGAATFDALEDPSWSRRQYEFLRDGITAGTITP